MFVSLSFSVRTTSVVERCRHRWMKLQERSRGTEQWRWWLETSPQQQQHHKATLEVVECLIRLSQSSQTCYVNAASHRLKWKSISSSLVLSLEMNNSEFDMCVVLSHQSPNISIYRHSISIRYPKKQRKKPHTSIIIIHWIKLLRHFDIFVCGSKMLVSVLNSLFIARFEHGKQPCAHSTKKTTTIGWTLPYHRQKIVCAEKFSFCAPKSHFLRWCVELKWQRRGDISESKSLCCYFADFMIFFFFISLRQKILDDV